MSKGLEKRKLASDVLDFLDDKYWGLTGIITLSATASALMVNIPNEGFVSIRI